MGKSVVQPGQKQTPASSNSCLGFYQLAIGVGLFALCEAVFEE